MAGAIAEFEATRGRFDEDVLRNRAARFSEAEFLRGFEEIFQAALRETRPETGLPEHRSMQPSENLDWSAVK